MHTEMMFHLTLKKNWDYIFILGTVQISLSYFWENGKGGGVFTLDKELNLPGKHFSYMLQELNQILAVDSDFDHACEVLEKILKINIWSRQSEEINRDASKRILNQNNNSQY